MDLLGGPGFSPAEAKFFQSALQVAEKVSRFVGRAFRHDIKSVFSSGVSTPEGPKPHFSAACLAADFSMQERHTESQACDSLGVF